MSDVMVHLTPEQADVLWHAIDDHRTRTADLVAGLTPEQLDHPSLCEGWTVRHVAAHLTTQQDGLGTTLAFMIRNPRLLRHLEPNAAGRKTAVVLAEQLSVEEIVAGSTLAAGRIWDNRGTWLARMLRDLPLDGYRFVATDVDWAGGEGPEARGPIGQLLLLLCGRPVALSHLDGEGADRLRAEIGG